MRSFLYKLAKLLGDVNSVQKGKVAMLKVVTAGFSLFLLTCLLATAQDKVTMKTGKTYNVEVLRYDHGEITIRNRSGETITGPINKIGVIEFGTKNFSEKKSANTDNNKKGKVLNATTGLINPKKYHSGTDAQRQEWQDSMKGRWLRGKGNVIKVSKGGGEAPNKFLVDIIYKFRASRRGKEWSSVDSISGRTFPRHAYRIYTDSRKALNLEKGKKISFKGKIVLFTIYHSELHNKFSKTLHIQLKDAELN